MLIQILDQRPRDFLDHIEADGSPPGYSLVGGFECLDIPASLSFREALDAIRAAGKRIQWLVSLAPTCKTADDVEALASEIARASAQFEHVTKSACFGRMTALRGDAEGPERREFRLELWRLYDEYAGVIREAKRTFPRSRLALARCLESIRAALASLKGKVRTVLAGLASTWSKRDVAPSAFVLTGGAQRSDFVPRT